MSKKKKKKKKKMQNKKMFNVQKNSLFNKININLKKKKKKKKKQTATHKNVSCPKKLLPFSERRPILSS